jgi:hypothetical protein
MEHWGPDGPLTGGRVAVRWPDDGCKVVAGRKLFEGGTQAQRGEEESGDGCDGDRVRPRPFIGARGRWRWPRKAGRRR